LDFIKTEMGIEGNFGSDENLIICKRLQNRHISALYKQYLLAYVCCADCRKLNTELHKDQRMRIQQMKCLDCGATRTVESITKHFHAKNRGERKRERNM
jgi:translation initiation factor 2 beta subunit (eIF-2beta)/eIF-5